MGFRQNSLRAMCCRMQSCMPKFCPYTAVQPCSIDEAEHAPKVWSLPPLPCLLEHADCKIGCLNVPTTASRLGRTFFVHAFKRGQAPPKTPDQRTRHLSSFKHPAKSSSGMVLDELARCESIVQ